MSDIPKINNFYPWREALRTGNSVEWDGKTPAAGYYKRRSRNTDRSIRHDAIGFWQEDNGDWFCNVNAGYQPRHFDEIVAAFAGVTSSPIEYDLFMSIINGGQWPDEPAKIEIAPDLAPHEAAAAELKAQQDAAKEWLTSLGRKPTNQQEADKAANYAEAFSKIEKNADKSRVAEKEPFLEAGRAVDARYKPITEAAATAKKWMKGIAEEYVKAEAARRAEEARIANEKAQREFAEAKAKADAEAVQVAALAAKGVIVPEFAPQPKIEAPKIIVAEKVHIGTGSRKSSLRTFSSLDISDATALLHFLADRNYKSEAFLEAALKEGRALVSTGVTVPGLVKTEKTEIV